MVLKSVAELTLDTGFGEVVIARQIEVRKSVLHKSLNSPKWKYMFNCKLGVSARIFGRLAFAVQSCPDIGLLDGGVGKLLRFYWPLGEVTVRGT